MQLPEIEKARMTRKIREGIIYTRKAEEKGF